MYLMRADLIILLMWVFYFLFLKGASNNTNNLIRIELKVILYNSKTKFYNDIIAPKKKQKNNMNSKFFTNQNNRNTLSEKINRNLQEDNNISHLDFLIGYKIKWAKKHYR